VTTSQGRAGAFLTAVRLEGYRDSYKTGIEDRAANIPCGNLLILSVADGAGGVSGGARAADQVVEILRREALDSLADPAGDRWRDALSRADERLANDRDAGETTAVVVAVSPTGVSGASVGDSQAWIVRADGCQDLTRRQERKPLLGSGMAYPIAFECGFDAGTVLLGSDGLFKYAEPDSICRAANDPDIEAAADRLLALVRLPSGNLKDDVAIILCRRRVDR